MYYANDYIIITTSISLITLINDLNLFAVTQPAGELARFQADADNRIAYH